MREPFELRRRRNMPAPNPSTLTFTLEPPPELPRVVEPNFLQRALPWLLGLLIIGMVVMMFVTGAGVMRNPMYLIMMVMVIMMAVGAHQNGGRADMSTPEVDAERAEYLRYLSDNAALIREAADRQRTTAQWSHPSPQKLDSYVGSSSGRMWERGRTDKDFLKIRIGLDEIALEALVKVKAVDAELDLEPVARTALQHLRAVQQSIHHCPKAIDFAGISQINIYAEAETFASVLRAWLCQAQVWHSPATVGVVVISPQRLESDWGWIKWAPHVESGDFDGAGPARNLFTTMAAADKILDPILRSRATRDDGGRDGGDVTAGGTKHFIIVVDDPRVESSALKRMANREGVTVISRRSGSPDRDYEVPGRELVLRVVTGDAPRIDEWNTYRWRLFCEEPDFLAGELARHITASMARWDTTAAVLQDRRSATTHTLLSILGIENAAALDLNKLWPDLPEEQQLRVPLGLQPSGAPLMIDLKDEAVGGMGPHGLMIGMTGSGKTTTLRMLLFCLFTLNSPDVVQAILGDFKGESGVDAFRDYPHVRAVVSNMEEKQSLVERFGDMLLGLLHQREKTLHRTGNAVRGEAFKNLSEYNAARAEGADLAPMPTMFVIVDEFSLLLQDHPDMADVFDKLCRIGRALGIFFLFASQTLDVGVVKRIPDNTQYKICLKVASTGTSRMVIGTEEAFHIQSGKNSKGVGYFVRAPGAEPVKFRSCDLPDRYEPPRTVQRTVVAAAARVRTFTAERVEPDPGTIIETVSEAETTIVGPPRSLILTVGPQLEKAYGKHQVDLWAPPLDDPIPLDEILAGASADDPAGVWWPVGKVDEPRLLRHSPLTYNVEQGNVLINAGPRSGATTALQTFVLSAASRYTPTEVGFYLLSYGSPALASIRNLPHVGALGGSDSKELTWRIFGDLDAVLRTRRRLFADNGVASINEYRARRRAGEDSLDDGYPTDLFLVIDGWSKFKRENTSLMSPTNPQLENVTRIADADAYGLHVVITSGNWIDLGITLHAQLKTIWELKLGDGGTSRVKPNLSGKMIRPQETIPGDRPGRGINMTGETIRFAVGRTDGQGSVEGLDEKIRETAAQISARYAQSRPVPRPQLLPTTVAAGRLPQRLGGEKIALGLRGADLAPWVVDFAVTPLLGVFGDSGSGKTAMLRHVLRSIAAQRSGPDEAIIVVVDTKRDLMDERHLLIEGHDYYDTDATSVAARMNMLASKILPKRTPPADLGWDEKAAWRFEGPRIYIVADDADLIPTTVSFDVGGLSQVVNTWGVLKPFIGAARDNGLRLVMTHKAAGVNLAEMMPGTLPEQFKGAANVNTVLLNSTATKESVRQVKFEDGLPPGRGFLITASTADAGYVQLATTEDVLRPC